MSRVARSVALWHLVSTSASGPFFWKLEHSWTSPQSPGLGVVRPRAGARDISATPETGLICWGLQKPPKAAEGEQMAQVKSRGPSTPGAGAQPVALTRPTPPQAVSGTACPLASVRHCASWAAASCPPYVPSAAAPAPHPAGVPPPVAVSRAPATDPHPWGLQPGRDAQTDDRRTDLSAPPRLRWSRPSRFSGANPGPCQ